VITFKRITGFLALAACLVAVGCGSDDEGAPIPADIADQLQTRLDEVQRRFDFGGGACADIQDDSLPAVEDMLASLPDNVDPDVREALTDGFDRLFVLTDEQCEEPDQTETAEPEPEPVPPETTETAPPPETTETTPPPTETEAPQPTETEPAPLPGEGGDAGGAEGGDAGGGEGGDAGGGEGGTGGTGQGGDGAGVQGGTGGGALVPEGEG
jgi:hypothetical protein